MYINILLYIIVEAVFHLIANIYGYSNIYTCGSDITTGDSATGILSTEITSASDLYLEASRKTACNNMKNIDVDKAHQKTFDKT